MRKKITAIVGRGQARKLANGARPAGATPVKETTPSAEASLGNQSPLSMDDDSADDSSLSDDDDDDEHGTGGKVS